MAILLDKKSKREKEKPADKLARLIQETEGIPPPHREYRICGARMWRADFCWPALKVIVEVEGVSGFGGPGSRHMNIAGFQEDMNKYNAAGLIGFRVFRVAARHVNSGYAIRLIQALTGTATATAAEHDALISELSEIMISKRKLAEREIRRAKQASKRQAKRDALARRKASRGPLLPGFDETD